MKNDYKIGALEHYGNIDFDEGVVLAVYLVKEPPIKKRKK
jgi:hypothetical protein